jgi:hypothetical protein
VTSEQPRNVVDASAQVASSVVSGLVGTPALLTVVVLNVVAMGIACWFLAKLADATAVRTERMMQLIADCMKERHSS